MVWGRRCAHSSMVIGLLLAGSFLGHLFGFGVVIFVFGFVFGAFDLVFKFGAGLFEFAHALAEATCEFGDLLGAEEKEDDEEDDGDFGAAEGPGERECHGDRVIWFG